MKYAFNAFTLIELLIGMIISAILIFFCYTAFSVIYGQYLNYRLIKSNVIKIMEFNTILDNDFNNADVVLFEDNKLILGNEKENNLVYYFYDSVIVRKNKHVLDTFILIPIKLNTSFVSMSLSMVKDFSFEEKKTEQHFHFQKTYTSEQLLKYSSVK